MAARYLLRKEVLRRIQCHSNELYTRVLRSVYQEHLLYTGNRQIDWLHEPRFHYAHYLAFKRCAHSAQQTRWRDRCAFGGASRAVFVNFKMSRFVFKMYARNGYINGMTKAS